MIHTRSRHNGVLKTVRIIRQRDSRSFLMYMLIRRLLQEGVCKRGECKGVKNHPPTSDEKAPPTPFPLVQSRLLRIICSRHYHSRPTTCGICYQTCSSESTGKLPDSPVFLGFFRDCRILSARFSGGCRESSADVTCGDSPRRLRRRLPLPSPSTNSGQAWERAGVRGKCGGTRCPPQAGKRRVGDLARASGHDQALRHALFEPEPQSRRQGRRGGGPWK